MPHQVTLIREYPMGTHFNVGKWHLPVTSLADSLLFPSLLKIEYVV